MSTRPRVLEFGVSLDRDWTARSDRGGSEIAREEAWTPEHLLLAGLGRCTLQSLEFHARRAAIEIMASVKAHGTVARREEDGRFAFVAIDVAMDVSFSPVPAAEVVHELVAKAERDCFVGASLRAAPAYTWKVNGEELR